MGLQAYYDNFAKAGAWKNPDKDLCGCRGHGWFISDLDTVHQCNLHYTGQRHPLDDASDEITQEDLDYAAWCCFTENWVNLAVALDPTDIPF